MPCTVLKAFLQLILFISQQLLEEGTLTVPSLELRWLRLAEVTQLIIGGARFGPMQFGSSLVRKHYTNHLLSTHLE